MKTATERLINSLPHGSGINGDWVVHITDKTLDIKVSNTYSAMQNGMYCHNWDFTVEYKAVPGRFEFSKLVMNEDPETCECGCGLQEYLEGAMPF